MRKIRQLFLIALLLLWTAVAAIAGPLGLGRERLKEYWGEPRKPSAAAKEKVGDALKRANLPPDAEVWLKLAENYARLDHEAAAEPAAYEGADKEVKAAWFTHGVPHLLDILHLAMQNETFVKDVWATQGLKGDAAEQAYRDLLLAIIGHDSQQLGFASPDKEVRARTRDNHALEGGVETAKAYGVAPGENPTGVVRQLTLGLAAAGHSKTAVKLNDPVQMATVVKALAKELKVTVTDAQIAQIIKDARPIAAMVGALDALRDRGPGGFGHTTAPCGENVIYRQRETGGPAIEVYNTKTDKVLKTFEGVNNRTFVEVNTKVELVQLEDGKLRMTVDFADRRIGDTARFDQIDDIGKDLVRVGLQVDVTYRNADGGWTKAPPYKP
jgi:hypothetical protein